MLKDFLLRNLIYSKSEVSETSIKLFFHDTISKNCSLRWIPLINLTETKPNSDVK